MKISLKSLKSPSIEMLPLIDIVFLLLVFFIYAMLSMAVHRGLPVILPTSTTAKIDRNLILSVTMKANGAIYVDKEEVPFDSLAEVLARKAGKEKTPGVLLFADRSLPYRDLFKVLDQIRNAGINRISLQAEAVEQP